MSTDNGGASAPADTSAVIDPAPVSTPNPISTESTNEPSDKATVSIDDALDRAAAKVDAKDKGGDGGDPAKPLKSEQPRDNGKFASKTDNKDAPKEGKEPAAKADPKAGDQPAKADLAAKPAPSDKPAAEPAPKPVTQTSPAPARFSADAKAVWDTAPEPVKAEVARMERELTAGIEKHRTAAERDAKLATFHDMAAQHGTDVHTALTKYTNMESLLRQNPLKGLEAVCDNIGVSLKDVARIVLGQAPDQAASEQEATIRDLRSSIQRLEQQLNGVNQRETEKQQRSLEEQIGEWAQGKDHFELLAPHIASALRNGDYPATAAGLDAAYEAVLAAHPQLAALKTSAAKPAAETKQDPAKASAAAAEAEEAQTLKGAKSITGAPNSGSNPGAKKRSKSIDEAIDAAFAAAG